MHCSVMRPPMPELVFGSFLTTTVRPAASRSFSAAADALAAAPPVSGSVFTGRSETLAEMPEVETTVGWGLDVPRGKYDLERARERSPLFPPLKVTVTSW